MIDIKKFCENIYIHHETVYVTDSSIMLVCNKKFISDDMQKLLKLNTPEVWRNLYLGLSYTNFEPVNIVEIEDILKGITPDKIPVYEEVECHECKGDGMVVCVCDDCDDRHERICKRCGREGYIDGKLIKEEIQFYRVIFKIQGTSVFIELISHRSKVYKEAVKRLIKKL